MQYTKLGGSELSVSRICLGCMGFGDAANGQHSWTIDEEHSREIIKRALELGVNFFDTAIGYQSGTSEQYVGRAVRDFVKREDVVIATKFLPRTQDEIEAGISGQQHIERMLNKSLENLGLDYVDLYIYHMWDYQTPLYEIMDGLNNMLGLMVSAVILSNNVFAFLHIRGHMSFARRLHMAAAYWGFLLMAAHLGLHWGMLLKMTQTTRLSGKRQSVLPTLLGGLIAAYGIFAIVKRDFPTYLFLRAEFVFLDFSESKVLFYLDYVAIMGAFIFLSHFAAKLLRKHKERKPR